jgi:hypothetical protein
MNDEEEFDRYLDFCVDDERELVHRVISFIICWELQRMIPSSSHKIRLINACKIKTIDQLFSLVRSRLRHFFPVQFGFFKKKDGSYFDSNHLNNALISKDRSKQLDGACEMVSFYAELATDC